MTVKTAIGSLLVGGLAFGVVALVANALGAGGAAPTLRGTTPMTGPDPSQEAGRRAAMNVSARDAAKRRGVKRALASRPRG